MSSATVRGGYDTFSGAGYPSREYGGNERLRLKASHNEAYIYLRNPAPAGATVTSATLTVHAYTSSSGARTLTCTPISGSWTARRLNWNNAPGVYATGATTTNVDVLADADPITFDVTSHEQAVVDGRRHFGWRITTNEATTAHALYAFDAGEHKPTLDVVWSDAPDAPTTLAPADAVVSIAAPVVQFDYTDVSGSTELAAVQVQVDPAQSASPAFDSGEVATTVPELDLAGTAYPGLADGSSTYWRVRVKDAGGLWSEWSDWVQITRHVKGTLTIDYPSAGAPVVYDHTPTIEWTPSEPQAFWRVWILDATDPTDELHDSGRRAGTATEYTIPRHVLTHTTWVVRVKSWDTVAGRVTSPGDPTGVDATQSFTLTNDITIANPTSVTATVVPGAPWVDLEWSAGAVPTYWAVYRDGVLVVDELDPAEAISVGEVASWGGSQAWAGTQTWVGIDGSGGWSWRDYGAPPFESHTYTVRAVLTKRRSEGTTSNTITTDPRGIWLADPDTATTVRVMGDEADMGMADSAQTFRPLSGDADPVRIVSGMHGFEGSASGLVESAADVSALWAMKASPATAVRLVAGHASFPALLGDVTIAPHPAANRSQPIKSASFQFWQVGRLPWQQ